MKTVIGLFLTLFASQVVAGDFIVKFKGVHSPKSLTEAFPHPEKYDVFELVKDMGIYRINIKTPYNEEAELGRIRSQSFVEYAQPNHKVKLRVRPNDSLLASQWSLGLTAPANIQAEGAWSITTGGKDQLGNDIVVAVIDGGFDIAHEDLQGNVWANKNEIAGNNIDDDGNGYVDDINGWNGSDNTNSIGVEDHGTLVSGIIGAKGNNGIGVSGVNWDSKLMFITISDLDEASVVASYGYALKQKELWLQTKGKKGANVVVTNSSFGIDAKNCSWSSFAVWNDMFNKLGSVGILSVAAAPNEDVDTDIVGDIPSACDSDYVIAVTNSSDSGTLAAEANPYTGKNEIIAGHGIVNVDLAAPGMNIFGTVPFACDYATDFFCEHPDSNKKYTSMTGTSFSTPHVAGSIALMFSAASEKLITKYYQDPAAIALEFKKLLLQSVTKTNEFSTQVSSGGYLNLYTSVHAASVYGK